MSYVIFSVIEINNKGIFNEFGILHRLLSVVSKLKALFSQISIDMHDQSNVTFHLFVCIEYETHCQIKSILQ